MGPASLTALPLFLFLLACSGEVPDLQLSRAAESLRLDAGVRRCQGVVVGAVGGSWEGLLGKG